MLIWLALTGCSGARAERPIEAPVAVDPCEYAGTLVTRGRIYSEPAGGHVIYELESDGYGQPLPVDVLALEPPGRPGERGRIALSAPVEVSGWLEADARPLAVRERLDLVPGHVWLDPGFEVPAHGPMDGTMALEGHLPGAQGIERPDGGPLLPNRVSCHALELSARGGLILPTASDDDPFIDLGEGRRTIFDAPGGAPVALVSGGLWQLLDSRDGWWRVAEAEPVHVEGWVDARDTDALAPPSDPDGVHLLQWREP